VDTEKFGQFKGTVNLRSQLCWDTAQHRLAVVYQCFGQHICPIFKVQAALEALLEVLVP
jgi:hypothetical protein